MKNLVLASYGAGTNSTALLIEYVNRGLPVDLILFADTGGERPHTYAYVELFSNWLESKGYPRILTVKKTDKNGDVLTLEQDSLNGNRLPSLAYGFKTCSQKYKGGPQDKFCNNHKPFTDHWKIGGKVTKLIGFDADEPHRVKDYNCKKYDVIFPLVDFDMGRDECIEVIEAAGLPLPGKSACFFCPSSKPSEIKQLAAVYPDLAERALAMEANAELTEVKGLGRSYAWKDIIATDDMFAADFNLTPELICGCYDG